MCPACHREQDDYPAGYLSLKGGFINCHREEVMNLILNREMRDRTERPLKRIMGIVESEDEELVAITDIHLARGLGGCLASCVSSGF